MANRGVVLCALLGSVAAVELPKWAAQRAHWQGLPLTVCWCLFMAVLPFVLARIAPRVAGFDRTFLPSAWSHWLWLPVLVLVLFVISWIVMLASRLWHEPSLGELVNSTPSLRALYTTVTSPWNVVFRGIVLVVAMPLAEEVFWRGYVLDRLRTLTHWGLALLIQSVLFALAHLPDPLMCAAALFYGAVLGVWRIRFRSLLPLIVAHAVLNGIAFAPKVKEEFRAAIHCYPKICEIDRLANEPAEKAVPRLIAFLGDSEEPVSVRAAEVLVKSFAGQAEPYLKEALRSNDSRTLENVLFAVELGHFSGLAPEVYAIAYEFSDRLIQVRATMALAHLRDEAALQDIADRHPEENVRRVAKRHLDFLAGASPKGP